MIFFGGHGIRGKIIPKASGGGIKKEKKQQRGGRKRGMR